MKQIEVEPQIFNVQLTRDEVVFTAKITQNSFYTEEETENQRATKGEVV